MKKKKSYKFYYILGGILCFLFVLVGIFGISLTRIFPGVEWVGWAGVIICSISIIMIFYSIYLLKKGNYLRINYLLDNKTNENNKEKK